MGETSPPDPTTISPLVTIPVVRELPPSCKLVWYVLNQETEATQQALVEATGMSPRTVRYAVDRLHDEELVTVRPYPQDARQCVYSLSSNDN
jgi:DNA-binding MarR family transcriptional regulator